MCKQLTLFSFKDAFFFFCMGLWLSEEQNPNNCTQSELTAQNKLFSSKRLNSHGTCVFHEPQVVDESISLRTRISGHFQRSSLKGLISERPLLDWICASSVCRCGSCFPLLVFGCANKCLIFSYWINTYILLNLQCQLLAYTRQSWTKVLLPFAVFWRQPKLWPSLL